MRLLLVEDDRALGQGIRVALGAEGYTLDWLQDGLSALHALRTESFDLLLLDLGLPRLDGLDLLQQLRAGQYDLPVLILTARDGTAERIAGLDTGADDYLIKPFSFAELVARLRTLTRRGPTREEEQLQIDDLQIDVIKRRVTRAGVRVTLTNKEFALLHLFATHQGQVLSRSLIASRVWDMNFDSDTNVVDVAVRRLRLKIDDPFQLKLIHSVRGIGYRFDTQP